MLSAATSPSYLPEVGRFHHTHGKATGGARRLAPAVLRRAVTPVTGKEAYQSAQADGTRAAVRDWD